MNALSRLESAGFTLRLVDGQGIGISPSDQLSEAQTQLIRENRQQIVRELEQRDTDADNPLTADEQETWSEFLSLASDYGVTVSEVIDAHRIRGVVSWPDVAALVGADLPAAMVTLAAHIKAVRRQAG